MKSKTNKILISALLLITILFIVAYFRLPHKEISPTQDNNQIIRNITEESVGIASKTTSSQKTNSEINKIPEPMIKASVVVSGKSYDAIIPANKNVYDLMAELAKNPNNSFTFHVKEYPGMGYFVDSINNVKGTPGAYWIYYINDKKASTGISQYIVKDGDIIRWGQEGI